MNKPLMLCRSKGDLGDALEAALAPAGVITPKGPYAPVGDAPQLDDDLTCDALVLQLTPPPIEQSTESEFDLPPESVWQSHNEWLKRIVRITQIAGRGMLERRSGRVIFILPAEMKSPHEMRVVDSAYASALQALAKHMANEWTSLGVSVNTLLWRGGPGRPSAQIESLVALIRHLVADSSAHISGAAIAVDGGHGKALF